jgi:hypothetical protein
MQDARQLQVVDVRASASEQARIVAAPNSGAQQTRCQGQPSAAESTSTRPASNLCCTSASQKLASIDVRMT